MKTVYQLDASGYYIGEATAQESPREPGVYLIPRDCVEVAPPPPLVGTVPRYQNGEWALVVEPDEKDKPSRSRATPAMVKTEAARRTAMVVPPEDQLEILAEGLELQFLGDARTREQNARVVVLRGYLSTIKAIKDASRALQTMDPIPQDFASDKHWP